MPMPNLNSLLVGIKEQTDKIYEAGERSALAGSCEHPQEEERSAQLTKIIAETEILGVVGKFLDQVFDDQNVVIVEAKKENGL